MHVEICSLICAQPLIYTEWREVHHVADDQDRSYSKWLAFLLLAGEGDYSGIWGGQWWIILCGSDGYNFD